MAKNTNHHLCQIYIKRCSLAQLTPAAMVRASVIELICTEHSDWNPEGYICHQDLHRYRSLHVQSMLESERGELSRLEKDVVGSMCDGDLIAENIEHELDSKATFGEQMADRIRTW